MAEKTVIETDLAKYQAMERTSTDYLHISLEAETQSANENDKRCLRSLVSEWIIKGQVRLTSENIKLVKDLKHHLDGFVTNSCLA